MPNRSNKKGGQHSAVKEFVTVAFAEDMDLAKQYKKLLEENDIHAAIKAQEDSSSTFPGIAVMVPEEHLDEAHILIESQGTYDDFYDMAFQDEEDAHFDEDYDDEF